MLVDQAEWIVAAGSLAVSGASMFFTLRTQVKVLEKQVERLEIIVNELRQDIKKLLMLEGRGN